MSIIGDIIGNNNDKTGAILSRHLNSDFIAFPMSPRPCTKDEYISIENKLGFELPRQYKAHVSGKFPGIYVEAKESVWPRAKLYDVGPFWSFLYGLHTFTICQESEDWMRADVVSEQLFTETKDRVLPLLKIVGDADIYCAKPNGKIVRFSHETLDYQEVNEQFWDILDKELTELVERTNRKKSG